MRNYLLLSLFGIVSSGCSFPLGLVTNSSSTVSTSAVTPSLSQLDPQLTATTLAILDQNCSSCHTQASGPASVYNLTDVTHLFSSGLMIAGAPDSSPLFVAISSARMPPAGALSAADQATIRNFIASAAAAVGSNPSLQPPTPEPKFSYIESQILGPKCTGCHYQGNASGGYAFDTYSSVLRAVNTGTPTNSKLYNITRSGEMPPLPGPALSSEQLNLILTWIQSGAANN